MKKLFAILICSLLVGFTLGSSIKLQANAKLISPRAVMGQNLVEFNFTENGKPVAGLKLRADVAMTSMDMGTDHPSVAEISPGKYEVKATFTMDGPWRITLTSDNPKFSLYWDITAGAKEPWKPVEQTVLINSGTESADESAKPQMGASPSGGMESSSSKGSPPISPFSQRHTPESLMPPEDSLMPQLKPSGSYVWTQDTNFDTKTGFGKLTPMVRMMMLMMVGGSGMEGMKMMPMDMKFDNSNFTDAPSNEQASGVDSAALKVTADIPKPKVGENKVSLKITNPSGEPILNAICTASVSMANMDMGTSHPEIKSLGHGNYEFDAEFSMAGPWRIVIEITTSDKKTLAYTFNFDAK